MKLLQRCVFLFLCLSSNYLMAKYDYILCFDGGGSKTSLQVLNQKGDIIPLTKNNTLYEKIEATGSNINTIGKEGVQAVLTSLIENVSVNKNTALADILPSCYVVGGFGGLGLPKNKEAMKTLFEEFGINKENIHVTSDAELSLQLIDNQGIILIAGTGSICFGKNSQKLFRVGGLGRILADEGSGYHIGLHALKAALAEEYGWGAKTILTTKLKEFYKVSELKTLIPKINLGEMNPGNIASSAPLVFAAAWEDKDSIAAEIIDCSAEGLGELLNTQLKLSQLSDCELHLWGGIFKNAHVEEFIQKVMQHTDNKNLKICNFAHENVAILYARKFLL